MKTNEQIVRHLRNCEFSDDDWQKVLLYCREHKFRHIHKATRPLFVSSFQSFTEWVDTGFGVGDVVRHGEKLYVVGDSLPDNTIVIGEIDANALTMTRQKIKTAELSHADKSESDAFLLICKANGVKVSGTLGMFVRDKALKKWEKIKFSCNGKKYLGIMSGYDAETRMCSFAFTIYDGLVTENQEFYESDIKTLPFNSQDEKSMRLALELSGLRWNMRAKRLEPHVKRGEMGQTYWYISDVFTVRNGIEKDSAADRMRIQSGNYFLSNSDAILYLSKIMSLRVDMLRNNKGADD